MNRTHLAAFVAGSISFACTSDDVGGTHGGLDGSTSAEDAPNGRDGGTNDDASSGDAGTSTGDSSPADAGPEPGAIVDTPLGRIQGYEDGPAQRFRGIRYAKAPEGALRWKPPQAVDPWTGVLDARDYGSACAQPAWIQGPESLVEDCLFLNVWTPDVAPGAPLPVMVWLPGGGNQNGAASDRSPLTANQLIYDGKDLALSGNVVVVTLNYRLGAFGFFAHPGLTAEGSNSGNQGLLDQQAALQWVRDNVSAFGGDPANVTLFGESAGSQDTCLQVVSPGSQGLFDRAISESGGCMTFRKTKATAEAQAAVFAEAAGCGAPADPLACLRGKPVGDLLLAAPVDGIPDGGADAPGGSQFRGGTPRWEFNPIVDGTVIPDQPRALVGAGTFAKVPYILGANFEEGALFMLAATPVATEAEYTAALGRLFGTDAANVAAMYPVAGFPTPNDALVRVWGDYRLGCSTYVTARHLAAQGVTTYTYTFERAIPGLEALRATHGVEMPYVFGTLPNAGTDDARLSDTMQGYWSRFARAGDPNGGGALAWPAFTGSNYQVMSFDVATEVVTDFRKAECDFWETIYAGQFP